MEKLAFPAVGAERVKVRVRVRVRVNPNPKNRLGTILLL